MSDDARRPDERFAIISFPSEARAVVDVDFANDWETACKHIRRRHQEGRHVAMYEHLKLEVRPMGHDGFPWANLL